jgi:hypothetical protein
MPSADSVQAIRRGILHVLLLVTALDVLLLWTSRLDLRRP